MISFLLHLNQPSYQDESVFRKVYEQSYFPLLKFIQTNKDFKVTLNTPLSLLEQMDRYGYQVWIEGIKKLIEQDRVEVVGSAAYHPLLTKVPDPYVEGQIILNEYGLGYYFGQKQGFEGEKAVMIKNVYGFFPPELAVNDHLMDILTSLGYNWCLVDEVAIPKDQRGPSIFSTANSVLKVVVRNSSLSNQIAFKRNSIVNDIDIQHVKGIIALDGETFGHHNTEGIRLLDNFYYEIKSHDILICTVSQFVQDNTSTSLNHLVESSWGASEEDITNNNPYVFWVNKDSVSNTLQWEVLNSMLIEDNTQKYNITEHDYVSMLQEQFKKHNNIAVDNEELKDFKKMLIYYKIGNSDQYWWNSKKTLKNGTYLYDMVMLKKSLALYREYIEMDTETYKEEKKSAILGKIQALEGIVSKNED